jgi:predicted Zn-dependent peptidase
MRHATVDIGEIELNRAKAQMKVALLTALETPGGRIERIARQLLSWGRLIPSDEIVRKVDALHVDQVREAGRRLLGGAPTLAAIGPIKGLPSLDSIAAGLRG